MKRKALPRRRKPGKRPAVARVRERDVVSDRLRDSWEPYRSAAHRRHYGAVDGREA